MPPGEQDECKRPGMGVLVVRPRAQGLRSYQLCQLCKMLEYYTSYRITGSLEDLESVVVVAGISAQCMHDSSAH